MIKKYLLLVFLSFFLITSCKHKKENPDYLVKWDDGSITLEDLIALSINENTLLDGKDELKKLLLKQSYKKIFKSKALQKNLQKSEAFLDDYKKRENKILANALLSKEINADITVSDFEIKAYFSKNIEQYTSSQQVNLYVNVINCQNTEMCNNQLSKDLLKSDFKTLSINNELTPSGLFENTPIKNLSIKIQKEIKNLSLNQVSIPIKLDDNKFMYVMIDKYIKPNPPKLENHRLSIINDIKSIKRTENIEKLKKKISTKYPYLNPKSEEELFASYAKKINLNKEESIINRLVNFYDWILADHGFFESEFFDDLNINTVKERLTSSQLNKMSRYTIQYIKKDITNDNIRELKRIDYILEANETESILGLIEEKKQITKDEFNKEFKALSIIINTIKLNEWSKGKIVNNQMWWIKKTYQGLATDDAIFFQDYKKLIRFNLGSISYFMKNIGNDINIKINPIIYSKDWKIIAEKSSNE